MEEGHVVRCPLGGARSWPGWRVTLTRARSWPARPASRSGRERFGLELGHRRTDRRVQLERDLRGRRRACSAVGCATASGVGAIYQWDLLLYAFGLLWIIFAVEPWMLIAGYVFTGLAVGADVPASWTLIAEIAPKRSAWPAQRRGAAVVGRRAGGRALDGTCACRTLGLLGIRLVFAHLLVVAIVLVRAAATRATSRQMWERERGHRAGHAARRSSALLAASTSRRCCCSAGMYGIWNLKAGTSGFFMPVHPANRRCADRRRSRSRSRRPGSSLGCLGTYFVFMRLVDRANQRRMFTAAIVTAGRGDAALLATLPLTTGVAIALRGADRRLGRRVRAAAVLPALERRRRSRRCCAPRPSG